MANVPSRFRNIFPCLPNIASQQIIFSVVQSFNPLPNSVVDQITESDPKPGTSQQSDLPVNPTSEVGVDCISASDWEPDSSQQPDLQITRVLIIRVHLDPNSASDLDSEQSESLLLQN